MIAYPLLFEPILKARVWGGRRLEHYGKTLGPAGETIGESWEIADLPPSVEGGKSIVANGPHAGSTIRSLIDRDPRTLLGDGAPSADGGFPLLIKLLDARENLSVQVHPTPAYARTHPDIRPKFEAWVVLEAEPGAVIYKGVRPGTDRRAFAEAARRGNVEPLLSSVPARAGECHDLPAGTCHALGGGVVIAEVQTPSDTTFRLYDWGRPGRDLHIEEALACVNLDPPTAARGAQARSSPRPILVNGLETTDLLETDHFSIERIEARRDAELAVVTDNFPVVWMVFGGAAEIAGGGVVARLARGRTVLLPAGLAGASARLGAGCSLLRITLPSPARGLIA